MNGLLKSKYWVITIYEIPAHDTFKGIVQINAECANNMTVANDIKFRFENDKTVSGNKFAVITTKTETINKVYVDSKKEVFDDLKKMGYGFDNFTGSGKTVVTEDEWKEFENKHLRI